MPKRSVLKIVACVTAATAVVAGLALGAALVFGTATPPPALASMTAGDRKIGAGLAGLPAVQAFTARDDARLAYRQYPGRADGGVAVLVHGSSGHGIAVHTLALALQSAGITVYTPDLRGHGDSGPLGDIGYVGQLEDDLADLLRQVPQARLAEPRILIGHSSGGGFTLRVAAGAAACLFDGYLALAPMIGVDAPSTRPRAGGWAAPFIPRIIALQILHGFGVTVFDGLPVIAFGVPADARGTRTRSYSMRLLANFGFLQDWRAGLRRIEAPARIMVGAEDELFAAEAYGPMMAQYNAAIAVTTLPGVDHMGIVLDGNAHAAVTEQARMMLARRDRRCG